MSKNSLTNRWKIEASLKVVYGELINLFQNGGKPNPQYFSTLLTDGKGDLRGINADERKLKKCEFENIDFSFSSFKSSWIENSIFDKCFFHKVDFSNISDHKNYFKDCSFIDCKFNSAGIGYDGTKFFKCYFENCNFVKAIFCRTEFAGVIFKDCRIKNIDFNASSFEDCVFEGELNDVWFRGGFPLKSDYEHYGVPKINEMKNVSFEKAELRDVTFSDNCTLSTVKINAKYIRYDNWKKRLDFVRLESSKWSDEEKNEAEIFTKTYLVHAKNQEWYIINQEDLGKDYGENVALKIVTLLNNFSI